MPEPGEDRSTDPERPEPAIAADPARPAAGLNTRLARLRRRQVRYSTGAAASVAHRREGSTSEPADGPDQASAGAPAGAGDRRRRVDDARRRLWLAIVRPGRGQLIIAVLLFGLGMAGVVQIRTNAADDAYTTARREDLVQLLDGLGAESRRLEAEIAELERTKAELQSGADTDRVAREQAQQRLDQLSILAGTAPAVGPGIRMRIADPAELIDPPVLIDAVEELRDAGAEVIEINDQVRLVASSWVGHDGTRLIVDGQVVSRPLTIEAIGDPQTLEEGARFRGGIVSEITGPRIGGQVQIEQLDRVVVSSLHTTTDNSYARPASPSPTR